MANAIDEHRIQDIDIPPALHFNAATSSIITKDEGRGLKPENFVLTESR